VLDMTDFAAHNTCIVDEDKTINLQGMLLHSPDFIVGQSMRFTVGFNPKCARGKGTVESMINLVTPYIENALKFQTEELAHALKTWRHTDARLELLIHRLAHAISQGYQSEGKPTSHPFSPSRKLCSRYLHLQLQEPKTPVVEILRRMLREADA